MQKNWKHTEKLQKQFDSSFKGNKGGSYPSYGETTKNLEKEAWRF